MSEHTEKLAGFAVSVAQNAASEYVVRHKLTIDADRLCGALRESVKAKLPEAFEDAREALQCGMYQIAMATFTASMVQAGIQGVLEASKPIGGAK